MTKCKHKGPYGKTAKKLKVVGPKVPDTPPFVKKEPVKYVCKYCGATLKEHDPTDECMWLHW